MKKSSTSKKYGTDFERLDAMKDEDIDFSEIPEATAERCWLVALWYRRSK